MDKKIHVVLLKVDLKTKFQTAWIFRHQDPAFDHEYRLRCWPHQGDQLHGARSDCCLPTHQIQRRLGCQAYLDPALLHAFLCSWHWTEASTASSFKERVTHAEEICLSLSLCHFDGAPRLAQINYVAFQNANIPYPHQQCTDLRLQYHVYMWMCVNNNMHY